MAREYDLTTGLYYVRNRWYDPQLGRFLSEDPIGLGGGINPYAYGENDPINHTDPWGLCATPYQLKAIDTDNDGTPDSYILFCPGEGGSSALPLLTVTSRTWRFSTPKASGTSNNFLNRGSGIANGLPLAMITVPWGAAGGAVEELGRLAMRFSDPERQCSEHYVVRKTLDTAVPLALIGGVVEGAHTGVAVGRGQQVGNVFFGRSATSAIGEGLLRGTRVFGIGLLTGLMVGIVYADLNMIAACLGH